MGSGRLILEAKTPVGSKKEQRRLDMPQIEDYRFGHIVIDGKSYSRDVIIYPDRVDDSWWRKEGHRLAPEDLSDVLRQPPLDSSGSQPPEVLVVGQGNPGLMAVPPETRERLEAAGITVIVEPTARACETYNRLQQEKRTIAALHLTC